MDQGLPVISAHEAACLLHFHSSKAPAPRVPQEKAHLYHRLGRALGNTTEKRKTGPNLAVAADVPVWDG